MNLFNGDTLLGWFIQILRFILKIILKILIFTGAWIALVLGLFDSFVIGKIFPHFAKDNLQGYVIYQNTLWVLIFLFMIYWTVRNVIRLVTKNPDFSPFKQFILKQKDKIPNAKEAINALSTTAPKGFIFGKYGNSYIAKPEKSDGHILVIGGAGSGKSSCIAIPSILSWHSRIFAIDIKGELYKKAGFKRDKVKIFNPLSPDTCTYDPYYLLGASRNPVQDAREIAQAIVQKPQDVKEPFWIDGAQNILTACILHFYNAGLSFIRTITTIQATPISQLVQIIADSPTPEARMFITQFVGMDIKTLSGIFAELSNRIMVFATDPDIQKCLSNTRPLTPDDLEHDYSVFIQIPEDKLEQWKSMQTLIVNQFLKHFERRNEENAEPILFLLDEYPRLGKIEMAINGLATLRSKKITICLIVQSLAQLDAIYGKENRQVIADNCQYKAILSATDADTQEYFSRLVGTYEKGKKSTSANSDPFGMKPTQGTGRTTEDKRMIKPEDFATLKKIVLLTPFGFLQVEKTPYYEDENFTN
jgi:type IV secretion system protein VirD4